MSTVQVLAAYLLPQSREFVVHTVGHFSFLGVVRTSPLKTYGRARAGRDKLRMRIAEFSLARSFVDFVGRCGWLGLGRQTAPL